jgi:cobaltochelatase CobN
MKERLLEAIDRSLWTPRSNSARFDLAARQQNEVNQ